MDHYDIFREQPAVTYPRFGHALWEPSPGGQHGPVQVGDVGFIRLGKFHRLFNALLSADHPSHHGIPLPEYHEPLDPKLADHIDRGILNPDHYFSTGVTVETGREDYSATQPEDVPQVSFLCTTRRGGAVLCLPVAAQRQDTLAKGDFGKWMIKNIDTWFAFARSLGLGIKQMEEVVLVTGLHLTRSWANVAFFEGQVNGQASLGVEVVHGSDVSIKWKCSPGSVRRGVRSWGPGGKGLPNDQCVFIRGFRVTRVFGILPRRLRGAAGPSWPSYPSLEEDDESDKRLISTDSPITENYRDPLHVLLEYLVERARGSSSEMVLIHDDDLAGFQGVHQPNALMDHLQSSKPDLREVLYDCPSTDEGSNTSVPVTVAMLSDEFGKGDLASTAGREKRGDDKLNQARDLGTKYLAATAGQETQPGISSEFEDINCRMIKTAQSLYRCWLSCKEAFPSSDTKDKWVVDVWMEACFRTEEHPNSLRRVQDEEFTCSSIEFLTDMKMKIKPVVDSSYEFNTSKTLDGIGHNASRTQTLLNKATFIYGDFSIGGRPRYPFRNPMIQDGVNTMWFQNKDDIGIAFHDYFSPIPFRAIAIVATVIECCIDEWSEGTYRESRWTEAHYESKYLSHLNTLRDINTHDSNNQGGDILLQIQQDLLKAARVHAGVPPDPTPIPGRGRISQDALNAAFTTTVQTTVKSQRSKR